jgi:hypothetical protein
LRILSIAWFAQQRRGETLARRLGAEFVKLPCSYRRSPLARLAQYRRLSRETTDVLNQRDPDLIVVQNPPIHAVAAVARYARAKHKDFIIDAHSGPFLDRGVRAKRHRRRFAHYGSHALVTLLHNEELISYAEDMGLKYLVLEDPVPTAGASCRSDASDKSDSGSETRPAMVVVVCGYGRDEPVDIVLKAATEMPDVTFHFTGRPPVPLVLPANARATGFLAEPDYWRLLGACDVVVALTTREATILGGGYDGLSAGKPLVLSRTTTLESVFPKGAVLVENRPEALAEGIRQALRRADDLVFKGRQLREEKARTWERQFSALRQAIVERGLGR